MKKKNLYVDNDPTLGYEKNSLVKVFLNIFFIPILNSLPVNFRHLVKKSHKSVGEIVDNKTTHKALEILYKNGHRNQARDSLLGKFFHSIWFNTNNSKAVRNRLRLVKRELKKVLLNYAEKRQPVKLLSIASGSARAVVEVLEELNLPEKIPVSVTFLDKNPEAIAYSKELTLSLKNHSTRWINDTVGNLFKTHVPNEDFSIVEMVGLMDYFNDEKAIQVFTSIYNQLEKGGVLITANISPNKEQKFISKIIGWDMVYRNADKLLELLIKSGFKQDNAQIYYEPLGLHSVIIVKK